MTIHDKTSQEKKTAQDKTIQYNTRQGTCKTRQDNAIQAKTRQFKTIQDMPI